MEKKPPIKEDLIVTPHLGAGVRVDGRTTAGAGTCHQKDTTNGRGSGGSQEKVTRGTGRVENRSRGDGGPHIRKLRHVKVHDIQKILDGCGK